ncbi:hypothetical protein SAMD00019534_035080 [Acytostelium subglobosum LB1]|uniref:hypothetical protein n=1 Tax=Acytostelium subglobosum LB1 TaxID=1410327 RepID=UPI000645230B|nr:hypothetical protein SAMD00019534_035080 [Acytostelium subglobosum LB1]GAM20333.1 hypothetical protein SAMD00019534_035080 [Acytostelium subglobosum LB1]|eukprot:XP_012759854.1 hypothetical protein SAMD00019534_035080 [Acytostelium subglobosum LB1]
MHKGNVVVLILLIVPAVLLIVSYSSYWYKVSTGDSASYYKQDTIKSTGGGNTIYTDWSDNDGDKRTHQIFTSAMAFATIAWIVDIIAVFFIVLSLLGILSKIPLLPFLTKFLPLAVLILSLISLFIFVGLPSAMKKDCQAVSTDTICDNDKQNKDLSGSQSVTILGVTFTTKWGPIQGFACVVVSAAFALGATVASFLMSAF